MQTEQNLYSRKYCADCINRSFHYVLKQHSVEDVVTALILNVICYQIFYRIIPENMHKFERMLTRKQICTSPNLLSVGRLALALVFMALIERYRLMGEKLCLQ